MMVFGMPVDALPVLPRPVRPPVVFQLDEVLLLGHPGPVQVHRRKVLRGPIFLIVVKDVRADGHGGEEDEALGDPLAGERRLPRVQLLNGFRNIRIVLLPLSSAKLPICNLCHEVDK